MLALISCKLPVRTYHKAVLSAHRYTGKTAEEAGMVHAARPDAHSTLQEAVKIATALGGRNYDRTVYQQIKLQMFKTEIERLEIRHAVPQGPPNLSKL
jgi:enoyl-CoA hydratase/carnithine racemase